MSQNGVLYAINSADGTVAWSHLSDYGIVSAPVIGRDGSVYVASNQGQSNSFGGTYYNIYALHSDGTPEWTFSRQVGFSYSPVVDASGVLFIGNEFGRIYQISPNGDELGNVDVLDGVIQYGSMAIAADGTLLVPTTSGFYAFGLQALAGLSVPSAFDGGTPSTGTVTLTAAAPLYGHRRQPDVEQCQCDSASNRDSVTGATSANFPITTLLVWPRRTLPRLQRPWGQTTQISLRRCKFMQNS